MLGPSRAVRFAGRILYLTLDPELLRAQLDDRRILRHADVFPVQGTPLPLLENISTDEIIPGWACYYYDATLARYCLVGLRGGVIATDAIKAGGFGVLVSGTSKGCGSSRETAPYSEHAAGIRLVIAPSFEKIYAQNAQNIGLLTSTDFALLPRIERGEAIPVREFQAGLDPISAGVVECGGLFPYNRARLRGNVSPPEVTTARRAMTVCEKILASHAVVDAKADRVGVPAVKPGDAFFVRTDVRFSHDYVTAMAESIFDAEVGGDARVADPGHAYVFRDHLTLLHRVMPKKHLDMGLARQAESLATTQEAFSRKHDVRLFGEVLRDGRPAGSEGVCHNLVLEEIALPGQVVVGTDSHTCMAGALGAFAFGVGSTDMASAWLTRDVRVTVPGTVRVVLSGGLGRWVTAKDVMLHLLAAPFFKSGGALGSVIEFCGEGVRTMGLDERSTLTNMAVEAGAFTGFIEADDIVVDYLVQERHQEPIAARASIMTADPGAAYKATFELDLGSVVPMVAPPGDPRGAVPLATFCDSASGRTEQRISIAYGGSCTGGKRADMDMYATVLGHAVRRGRRVAEGVRLYIQFGSQRVRRHAEQRGYLELFAAAGAELLDPSCGACIHAGPGASDSAEQVTVSSQNRNFPGRSGPGKVYLASPFVVAASAIAGKLASPEDLA
jgi:3-isopropylmalate/(R)-2-methylmalate dehydratase large subunit